MIIAFDLDGTLADITHRLHFIQSKPKNYDAFFKASVRDAPIGEMHSIYHALHRAGHVIDIWSGRSDAVRFETQKWLADHHLEYRMLRMRPDGDYTKDCVMKAKWFDALPTFERPQLAFDDRQQVVDMWRSKGVRCLQVAPGQF